MRRALTAILLSIVVQVAHAADPTPSKAQAKGGASKVTADQALAVRTSKAKFMSAAGACGRPETCDPASPSRNPEMVTMLQAAEETFMLACLQCATEKSCEEERVRIRAGKGRFGYNACMQGEPVPQGKAPTTGTTQKPK